MSLQLTKGQKVDLTKTNPTLVRVIAGLGWNPRVTAGADFDLDASAFLLNAAAKVRSEKDLIFYGNLEEAINHSVKHSGDNRTGAGEGDDETLVVDLSKVPADITRIVFTVTIYEAKQRKQNFGQVGGAYIRIVDEATKKEILKYDLSEDYSTETALKFGALYRKDGEWKFEAIGQGYAGGLAAVCGEFGIQAQEEQ